LINSNVCQGSEPLEKRRLHALAVGFLRFTQTATRSPEKRHTVQRKDDLDLPAYVAGLRRSMEEELEAVKGTGNARTSRPRPRMVGNTMYHNHTRSPPRVR
jgi:hypothetical protein